MSERHLEKTKDTDEIMVIKNNVLDENIFFEIKKYLYPIVKKQFVLIPAIILIILAFCFIFTKLFVGMTLMIFGVLVLVEFLTMENKAARNAFVQIRDAIHQDYCTYTYTLKSDKLIVRCNETNMQEAMPLDTFVRTAETKHTYILFNKESRMVIVRKDKLGEEKTAQLKEHIKALCPNMTEETDEKK